MDQNDNEFRELTRAEWESLISLVNTQIKSPKERAEKVYEILQVFSEQESLTDWDIICFCEEYLMKHALGNFSSMLNIAKALNTLIYQLHYQAPKEIGLIPLMLGEK